MIYYNVQCKLYLSMKDIKDEYKRNAQVDV